MDNIVFAYGLIALGLIFLAAELILPSAGVLFVLAVAALIAGVAMTFSNSASQGLITLVAVTLLILTLGPLAIHYWPKTRIGRKFFLEGPQEDATVANMPVHLELERLRGRYGKTVSPLRPAGITEFDGKRIDTMAEGALIDAGKWVRCIEVRSGRVFVRQVDRPANLGDFDLRMSDEDTSEPPA